MLHWRWKNRRAASTELARIPDWSGALEAMRAYRAQPSRGRLFSVFKSSHGSANLWYPRPEGATKDSAFTRFEAAVASGVAEEGIVAAFNLIEAGADPIACQALRFIFAARALLAHRQEAVADALIAERRGTGEALEVALVDAYLFRLACYRPPNQELFRQLLQRRSPQLATVAADWLLGRWRIEGSTAALLKESLELAETLEQKGDAFYQECLALAFSVGDLEAVDSLLGRRPSLLKRYKRILPLARHLARKPPAALKESELADLALYARFHDHLDAEAEALIERLSDQTRSIAIVGNSACERGMGNGKRIDGHDLVARFNRFSLEGDFAADYGRKLDIHCRRPANEAVKNRLSLQAGTVLISRFHTQRGWDHLVKLWQQGVKVCHLPPGPLRSLWQDIEAPPSLGLVLCRFVKELRGCLPRESCFGFSFTDQLAREMGAEHYFEDGSANLLHRWKEERALFDRMVSD